MPDHPKKTAARESCRFLFLLLLSDVTAPVTQRLARDFRRPKLRRLRSGSAQPHVGRQALLLLCRLLRGFLRSSLCRGLLRSSLLGGLFGRLLCHIDSPLSFSFDSVVEAVAAFRDTSGSAATSVHYNIHRKCFSTFSTHFTNIFLSFCFNSRTLLLARRPRRHGSGFAKKLKKPNKTASFVNGCARRPTTAACRFAKALRKFFCWRALADTLPGLR